MDFDYFRRIQESDVTYTHTNECLEAIVEGLNLNNNSKVLAILGSGDQTFAMAEFASKIVAVDISKGQVEYASLRLETLKERVLPMDEKSPFFKRINSYFDNDRLRRIRDRLISGKVSIDFLEGDIFSEDFLNQLSQNYGSGFFNRIYLSNAIGFSYTLIPESKKPKYVENYFLDVMNLIKKILSFNGLVYTSEYPKHTIFPIDKYLTNNSKSVNRSKGFPPTIYKVA